jgi:ribonucleoside-diphosphate reductase alpha chain
MSPNNPSSTTLADQLLQRRYLRKDAGGRVIETPEQMYQRVAEAVAGAEAAYGLRKKQIAALAGRFRTLMQSRRFLPNSPTLMNAGREEGLLSACFVLPVPDEVTGIFEAVKNTALIQKAGGGTGFAFDELRPTGDLVASSGGTTSGPLSFLQVFAETTTAIQQGAHRRGANMALMRIDHPDILKFITAKQTPGRFCNFNFSVKIPDRFMATLREHPQTPHRVENPRTHRRYTLPRDLKIADYTLEDLLPEREPSREVYTCRDLWDLIVACAHATGEPGIVFIDRINRDNPTPKLGAIEATNPCGEQPLLPYEACTLGSLNLARFVREDGGDLAWDELAEAIGLAVRFLDDVIDVSHYPIPQVRTITRANRKIGLGVMGLADALILLGIRYDSDEALALADWIGKFLCQKAHAASEHLAQKRGPFPHWRQSRWHDEVHRPMRNAGCTTIAPTGSISLIAGCSSGIEPIYGWSQKRLALEGQEFIEVHPLLEALILKKRPKGETIRRALIEGTPPAALPQIPESLKKVLVTAHEIAPAWHVRMAATFQQYIDHAVAKTVNLPANADLQTVAEVFQMAYDLGSKGITVYRDASRPGQTLSTVQTAPTNDPPRSSALRPRPAVTTGRTFKYRMGCGTLFVTVNRDEQGVCEVFANLGKAGGCPSQSEATCRVVSAALRSGVSPQILIEQLRHIRCLSALGAREKGHSVDVLSCPDAIARALEAFGDEGKSTAATPSGKTCRTCGAVLRQEGRCLVCDRCGESKCG